MKIEPNRRGFLGLIAAAVAAPAVIRNPASLMPVRTPAIWRPKILQSMPIGFVGGAGAIHLGMRISGAGLAEDTRITAQVSGAAGSVGVARSLARLSDQYHDAWEPAVADYLRSLDLRTVERHDEVDHLFGASGDVFYRTLMPAPSTAVVEVPAADYLKYRPGDIVDWVK